MTQLNKIVVLTGAGISAESGVPTFRDENGLWEQHKIEDVATPEGFKKNPDLVYKFYNERRASMGSVEPNKAHLALANFAKKFGGQLIIVTQNIDDLHERAGSEDVYHIHGRLDEVRCMNKGTVTGGITTPIDSSNRCQCCKEPARLRPNVVWFGETPFHIEDVMQHIADSEMFISIGTSGNVYPAAGFAAFAQEFNTATVSLNIEEPENRDMFNFSYIGPSTTLVPEFFNALLST